MDLTSLNVILLICKLQVKTCCTLSMGACKRSGDVWMKENYCVSNITSLHSMSQAKLIYSLLWLPQFHQFKKCWQCLSYNSRTYFYKITGVSSHILRKPGQASGLCGCVWHCPHRRIHFLLNIQPILAPFSSTPAPCFCLVCWAWLYFPFLALLSSKE